MNLEKYQSWGRYPHYKPSQVIPLFWREEIPDLSKLEGTILPFAYGKSYGDSCLNDGGVLLDTKGLNKFISFDEVNGLICCEAGVTLAEVLNFIVPRGWFLAVTPGTKHISVGGALANDVHGKNHHVAGTFGCQTTRFELLRSSGERLICSRDENYDMFRATIGGLGLTGLITWVEFKITPSPTPFFYVEMEKYDSVDEFFDVNEVSEPKFNFIVSWIDCTATGSKLGRGIYNRGNHADPAIHEIPQLPKEKNITFPFDGPFINPFTVNAFNMMYYGKQINKLEKGIMHYDPFFYPLDGILEWNKSYGKDGFTQYQFLIPFGNDRPVINEMLQRIAKSGLSSFMTVMKTFGDIPSPGMLSFPKPGVNLAIDFRINEKALKTLDELDVIVREADGILYPAKDAHMSAENFQAFYPQWQEFSKYIDPKFSSSFWRRVMGE